MRVCDRPILRPLRRLLLGVGLSLLALPGLARENFALLIGASDYQNLDKRWSLKGPRNDMDLVSAWLTGQSPVPFSPENVTVLTDGREGDIPATLGNIRQAFDDLTARLAPGDFVYLHLSGHGTRAPALDPASEPDGLDELFLPVDIGAWSNQTGAVENALVDDEIALLLDGLRNRGADVWIVFDACHSGTATRALETGDEVVMRQLDPEVLGITGAMLAEAEAEAGAEAVSRSLAAEPAEALLPDAGPSFLPRTAARPEPGVTPGSLVAFYAAQSTELTPEMRLPRGAPDRKSQGVFTYTLFEVLSEYPSATYSQVAQEVLRKYATRNAAKSTPLFEGDLDRVVFGGAPGGRIAQWPGRQSDGGFTLAAGALQGLGPGAELAVLARAADAPDQALGFVRVTEAEVFTARAEAIEKDGLTLPEDLPEGFYLRRVDVALDFALSIALPPPGTAAADALYAALPEVKAAAGSRLSFVEPGELADLALAVLPESGAPEAIWILPGTGFADPAGPQPKVEAVALSAAGLADELATKLGAMAKAINLMKLGAALGPVALDVDVTLRTRNAGAPELRGLELTPVPTLVTADEVHVLARNNMQIPVDVNVLYIGADYSIGHFYSGRLHPGEELKKGLFAIGGETMGAERMLVVMNPASPHSQVEDLSYLAQEAVRSLGTAGLTSLNAALFEAGFGGETRGAIALSSEEDTPGGGPVPGILQVELRTRAAD